MSDNDLSKSRIININDFIFKQNLQFYPNLVGLSCENNTINYTKNNNVIASVVLTFDLRTLPGDAWNLSPEEFMDVIKLNKECKSLQKFIGIIEKYGLNQNAYITGNGAA